VEQAALHLNYRPHAAVSDLMAKLRTLKAKTDTSTLGFINTWPTRDAWRETVHFRRFVGGIKTRAEHLGYQVEIFWLREPGMTSRRMSQILRTRAIRGLILQSLPQAHGHLSLEWQYFAAVTKGLTIARPRLHRVVSSHFEDMRMAMRQLRRLNYKRPGLVLNTNEGARVDRAWEAAFLLHQQELSPPDRVPALILETGEVTRFTRWRTRHQPDAIIFTSLPVPAWVADLGLRVPDDIGLVHLDSSVEAGSLSGIDADVETLGAAAVDLLVGQLHANEFGIPQREKIVTVPGRWVTGNSLRRMPAGNRD
jgi:LacI family transcriptional regulator